jgi:tryptophanyl-tRNA synthetase
VVDLHTLTQKRTALNAVSLSKQVSSTVAMYLACGIDPSKTKMFIQSNVIKHVELNWILTCLSPIGWLNRMTQYKNKIGKSTNFAGLMNYPILMASDVLLYDTDVVCVGKDQEQHIEFIKNIAHRFNYCFKDILKVPKSLISVTGSRIMGFNDPSKKMSKSSNDKEDHLISLLDSNDKIKKTIMSSVTDSNISSNKDCASLGIANLCTIIRSITNLSREEIESQYLSKGYLHLKRNTIDLLVHLIEPIRNRYYRFINDMNYIKDILTISEKKVNKIAEINITKIKNAIGLTY